MIHEGRCHCGAIRISFETERPLAPRACQCSFCRKHGARTVTDSAGTAVIHVGAGALHYRFASRAADYLLCGRCGVYLGAVAEIEGALYATLNANTFDDPHPEIEAVPVSYDSESAQSKAERRRQVWTPARVKQSES